MYMYLNILSDIPSNAVWYLSIIKSPNLGWLYVFSLFLLPRPHLHPLPLLLRLLLLLTSKPFGVNLRYLGQRKYRSRKMCLSVTLTQGHSCGIDKQKIAFLQDKMRTTHTVTAKLGRYIPLAMLITWLDFGEILFELFFAKFSSKILGVFFLGQTPY